MMDEDTQSQGTDAHVHTPGDGHDHAESAVSAAPAQPAAEAATPAANDAIGDGKLYAILGYILPFLFFLPMVIDSLKGNAFARFHANQQLILLILWIGVQFVLGNVLYMVLGMGAYALMPILNLAILVLAIMGIVHAAQGQMKELPVVGKFKLLK
jgi:uncharacterized membrane protein